MPEKLKNIVTVLACGSEKFAARFEKALPQGKFIISSCPLSSAAGKLADECGLGPEKAVIPAIIVADLSSGKPEGLSLCHSLVTNPLLSAIPFVAVVAENDFETAKLALDAGARDFIMKPLSHRNLMQKLEFLVYSSPKQEYFETTSAGISGSDGCDLLTGLPEADLFRRMAGPKLQDSLENGLQTALLLINLDHFRRVKSILGKDASDKLNQRVARKIESTVEHFLVDCAKNSADHKDFLIGQIGRDEFLVLISGIVNSHDVERLARALLSSVTKPAGAPDPKAYLTARIGITMSPDDGDNIDALISNVESLAHCESRQGRDSFRFYTSGVKNTVARRFELEAELSQGLHCGDLEIHYQPEVDLHTGEISGAEALVRWRHPQLGMLAPEAFIAVAEDVGLITEIGEWVLRQACLQCREWHKLGFGLMRVSINISPYQFSRVNMRELVEHALQEASLPPDYLTLEVTESLIIEDVEKTLAAMLDLKSMGVRLSLDDFGTGYSSLSYLHSLSVDYLKIDRAFVKELPDHAGGLAVTEAITRMAKALGLGITAEGVETLEQLKCLRSLGVNYYQGFYFSEPLPAQEFTDLLGDGRWKLPIVGKVV